ncbi:MAG: M48 family metallopeptidase [Salinisphaeraceae bacterium]|nr:M48 family metallopeptidase [Salinisphaeraceae bacterium]
MAKPAGENVNISKRSPLVEMVWLLGGALLLLLGTYFALGFAVDHIVQRMPDHWEPVLAEHIDIPLEVDEDDPFQDTVENLLEDLVDQLDKQPYDYEVGIAPSNEVNAFALPGGRIVVTRALITSVKSENELAMVLAHELGHFAHRDHLRGLGRGLSMAALSLLLFGADSGVTQFLTGTLNVAHAGFSRKQETAADQFALELLNAKYGHIGGATDFFERLAENESRWGEWLSTHPASSERVLALRQHAARQRYKVGQTLPLRP